MLCLRIITMQDFTESMGLPVVYALRVCKVPSKMLAISSMFLNVMCDGWCRT